MKRIILTILAFFLLTGTTFADTKNEMQELSGILHRSIKNVSPYYIELDGTLNRFYLRGEILKKFKEGDRIFIKGYIITELAAVFGSDSPVQQPSQWLIYMKVIEAIKIEKPFGLKNQ